MIGCMVQEIRLLKTLKELVYKCMNKHINKKKTARKAELKKIINTVHPNGNRQTRRSRVANDRLEPQRAKKAKIELNLKETKELGRIAKQKKLDKKYDSKRTNPKTSRV